ncbi:MAG TPA: hypothetical protein VN256_24920 [Pyrinomonadaceae bacterium]|nr:hypothetical protein [Pyrinomonadaceae bacterium]
MNTIKRFSAAVVLTLFALYASAWAQTPTVSTVNITPDSDKVRVYALGDVTGMRLEVSDEAGDIVFESGQMTARELIWEMRDSQGARVAPGTYTVAVSYRMPSGKLRKRVEQVTVTEEVTSGGGTEKTNAQTASGPTPTAVGTITGEGTTNRITKFTGPNSIDDSVMTESAGKIGLNTIAPTHALTVNGGPAWTTGGWTGSIALPNQGAIGWNANSAGQSRGIVHNSGGLHFFRTASNPGSSSSPALYDLTINNTGNVGVGTTVPASKLSVNGEIQILGAGNGIKFADGSVQTKAAVGSGSGVTGTGTVGSLVKFTATNAVADSVVKENGGNVGIGTSTPGAKLSVQGSGDPALLINHTGASGNPALWLQQDGYTRAYMWWDRTGNRLNLGTPTTNPIISFYNNGAIKIPPTTRVKSIHSSAFRPIFQHQGVLDNVDPFAVYSENWLWGENYIECDEGSGCDKSPEWIASVELPDGVVITEFCLSAAVNNPNYPAISANLYKTNLDTGGAALIARTFTAEGSTNFQNVCIDSNELVNNNKVAYSVKVRMELGLLVGVRLKYQVTQLP